MNHSTLEGVINFYDHSMNRFKKLRVMNLFPIELGWKLHWLLLHSLLINCGDRLNPKFSFLLLTIVFQLQSCEDEHDEQTLVGHRLIFCNYSKAK